MKCIVGLGNPGKEYESTRHNLGIRLVEYVMDCFLKMPTVKDLGEKKGKQYTARKFSFELATKDFEQVVFVRPLTFMNVSGEAVREAVRSFPSSFDIQNDLWVVHDEYALPYGTIKIDRNKSSAGHNGVQNSIDHLKTKDFVRFRIGIKQETQRDVRMEQFVLQKFSKQEELKLDEMKSTFLKIILYALNEGISKAQNMAHTHV